MTDTHSDISILSNRSCMPLITDNLAQPEHSTSSKKRKQKSSSSSTQSSRSSSRCRSRNTTVLQSPRMLSFPYHNDCLFLPTVEQHRQSEKARSIAPIRSGSFLSSSIPSTLPPSPTTTTPPSLKRRRVVHDALSPSSSKCQSLPSSCYSHSWIRKAWNSFTKSSWRRPTLITLLGQ